MCPKCKIERPIKSFGKRNWECKICQRIRYQEYKTRKPHQYKIRSIKNRWKSIGINNFTQEDYDKLLATQNGVCAICIKPPKTRALAVDHDHNTGVVRGLLCGKCNTGLGLLGDTVDSLTIATQYLRNSIRILI